MSVLLTSAGRRAYLVRYFQEALGAAGKVVVANTDLDSAAAQVADHAVRVPPSWDPEYVPTILNVCREHSIRLLCSLHDLDTYFLAPHAPELRETGAVPMLPDNDWGRRTLDKLECSRYLQKQGFDVPWTDSSLENARIALARNEIHFPLLVKARHGFGSLGLTRCQSLDELTWYYQRTQKQLEQLSVYNFLSERSNQLVLIQQEVSGQEYCVDLVNDLEGNYAAHFAGEVHGMRAGETDQLTTVSPERFGTLPRRISQLTRHPGIWGIDLLARRFSSLDRRRQSPLHRRLPLPTPCRSQCPRHTARLALGPRTSSRLAAARNRGARLQRSRTDSRRFPSSRRLGYRTARGGVRRR
jgi:carbamoyl-phosphate synthase large subunit